MVAMATYDCHRFIKEKWKLTVSAVSLEILDFFHRYVLVVLHVSYAFCPNRLIRLVAGAT